MEENNIQTSSKLKVAIEKLEKYKTHAYLILAGFVIIFAIAVIYLVVKNSPASNSRVDTLVIGEIEDDAKTNVSIDEVDMKIDRQQNKVNAINLYDSDLLPPVFDLNIRI